MTFLVVDKAILTCSYGTCSSKLKVTPMMRLPAVSLDLSLPSLGLGLGGGLGLGVSFSLPHGLVPTFSASGQLVGQANFEAGILAGESLAFDAEGRVTQKLMFIGGKLEGMASMFAGGVLTASMNFQHGQMQGESKFFDMQGRLVIQTNFAAGLEDGMRMTFNVETGGILKKELFIKGLLNGVAGAAGSLEAGLGGGGAGGLGFGFELPALPDVALDVDIEGDFLGMIGGKAMATVIDHHGHVNIRPFCYCTSLANPAVAEATKMANGQLMPQPCTPKTHSPWVPGSHDATMRGHATLTHTSKLICAYAGVISVVDPGQNKATVP